jgi:hypothetical protein
VWLLVLAAVIAALTWIGEGDPVDGGITLVNEITRGKRVTHAAYNDAGVVPDDPSDLASQAGVDLDTYAMARMISSEEGNSETRIKILVGYCLQNHCTRIGKTISQELLRANNSDHAGYFGTQRDVDTDSPNHGKSDRYASTALDPYAGDIEIAQGVRAGTLPDESQGAQQFDRPAGEKHPEQVAANRIASGAELVTVAGLDGIRLWRT